MFMYYAAYQVGREGSLPPSTKVLHGCAIFKTFLVKRNKDFFFLRKAIFNFTLVDDVIASTTSSLRHLN